MHGTNMKIEEVATTVKRAFRTQFQTKPPRRVDVFGAALAASPHTPHSSTRHRKLARTLDLGMHFSVECLSLCVNMYSAA